MTTQDILTLAKAGFTAQQIAALSTLAGQPSPAPAPAPAPPPAPPPAPAPQPPPGADHVAPMLPNRGRRTDAIQANGLLNANQPKQQTTDDILAAIIAPPIKKE